MGEEDVGIRGVGRYVHASLKYELRALGDGKPRRGSKNKDRPLKGKDFSSCCLGHHGNSTE